VQRVGHVKIIMYRSVHIELFVYIKLSRDLKKIRKESCKIYVSRYRRR